MVLVVSSPPGPQGLAGYPAVAGVAQRTGSSSPQWQTLSGVASPQWCGRGTYPVEYSFKVSKNLREKNQTKRKVVLMRISLRSDYVYCWCYGIKIESSDQSPFGEPIKGSR